MSETIEEKPTGVFDYLKAFIIDDNQLTSCPKCGVRTEDKISDHTLICSCPSCSYTFRGVSE